MVTFEYRFVQFELFSWGFLTYWCILHLFNFIYHFVQFKQCKLQTLLLWHWEGLQNRDKPTDQWTSQPTLNCKRCSWVWKGAVHVEASFFRVFRLLSFTTTRRFSNLFGDKNQYVVVNSANLCNSGSTALGEWSSFFIKLLNIWFIFVEPKAPLNWIEIPLT